MASPLPFTTRGRATRERIVRAAVGLIAERGVAGLSLDDVGEQAAASRSQLYHYFDDKDDLVRAAVGATGEMVLAGQDELLGAVDSWESLDHWFDSLVAFQRRRHARGGCPIGSLAGQLAEYDAEARHVLAANLERWEESIRDALARMQQTGALTAEADPAVLATAVLAALQGGLLLTQVHRDPERLRRALDGARSMLRAN